MAGVYIKGMVMPKDGVYWCEIGVADDIATITIHGEERKSFHLVPVPPHGDLIDANTMIGVELYDECREEWYEEAMTVWEYLGRASTANVQIVIPADRSEE